MAVSVAYNRAQVTGNTNIVAVGWNNSTSSITSVTDLAGNTYQLAVPAARGSGVSQAIYYAKNIKAAAPGTNAVPNPRPHAAAGSRTCRRSFRTLTDRQPALIARARRERPRIEHGRRRCRYPFEESR